MPSGACGAKSPGHSCTTASCVCCRPPGPRDVTPPLGTPHESGRRAEELAADFLRLQGFEILERNYRRRLRSEEHTSELQSRGHLVCRLLLEKKKKTQTNLF